VRRTRARSNPSRSKQQDPSPPQHFIAPDLTHMPGGFEGPPADVMLTSRSEQQDPSPSQHFTAPDLTHMPGGFEGPPADVLLTSRSEQQDPSPSQRFTAPDLTYMPDEFEGPLADVMLNSSHEHRSHQEVVETVTQELSSSLKTWQHTHIGRKYGEAFHDRIRRKNPIFMSHVNGTEVFVRKSLSFEVYWSNCTFVFHGPQSVKVDSNFGRRYIFWWVLYLQVLVIHC
jgi:hypothetical protein